MKKKRGFKIFSGGVLLALCLLLGYAGYVFFSYSRIEDQQKLTVKQKGTRVLQTDRDYQMTTYNVGYAAYPPSYSFFMDGGEKGKADDKATVLENLSGLNQQLKALDSEIVVLQEVDQEATRSYHVNEVKAFEDAFPTYSSVFALNFHSAYFLYPLTDPIGQSNSGLLTLSQFEITESTRYQLPIEKTLNKFFDLDRAFTISDIPTEDGATLKLFNVHLSAYMKDQKVQKKQIQTLFDAMAAEYEKGNYVICGGDFNHDLLEEGSSTIFENKNTKDYSWLKPFPTAQLPDHFQLAEFTQSSEDLAPSTRNLDQPYEAGKSFVALIDGFIVSDNVTIARCEVQDEQFQYSDHNPVTVTFSLKK